MIREAVLAMFGIRAVVAAPRHPAPVPVDSFALSHNDTVHDLHNQEAVALAGFQIQAKRSAKINRSLHLGDAADHVVREINDDAARMRAAMQDGFKRPEDDLG